MQVYLYCKFIQLNLQHNKRNQNYLNPEHILIRLFSQHFRLCSSDSHLYLAARGTDYFSCRATFSTFACQNALLVFLFLHIFLCWFPFSRMPFVGMIESLATSLRTRVLPLGCDLDTR